ncbi:MAG: hypothetical protein JKY45_02515 [Emcibacter sp.]|nr:hypothetical protein [Emcibacter sp.]
MTAKTTSPSLIEVILAHDTNTARVLKDSNTIQSTENLRADNADLREALNTISEKHMDTDGSYSPAHGPYFMWSIAQRAIEIDKATQKMMVDV